VVASLDHSLALDIKGNAYTWGAYQISRTPKEVKDAMGSIINYTLDMNTDTICETEPRLVL
jgi:hypothetical protein